VKENYYALLICILKPVTIEQGFDLLDGRITHRNNMAITSEDIEDMIRMKQQGMTHREIGSFYGISEEAAYRRIKRYKEKKEVCHG
jgi:DNA invertase Pin-like site-specific DNA recombinase